jgi:hypothetical protein
MKKTLLAVLLPLFLMTISFSARAGGQMDKPQFFAKAKAALNNNQDYKAFKASGKMDATAFGNVETTVINYFYFRPESRIRYFSHMLKSGVDKGIFSEAEARQLKAILNAASMRNVNATRQAVAAFQKNASTPAGKEVAEILKKEMMAVDAAKDGRQSLEGFFGALGKFIGAVVGAVAGAIGGGIAGAIAGALGGAYLGKLIGGALDDLLAETPPGGGGGSGNGVWAGPDGTHCDTPPFCG